MLTGQKMSITIGTNVNTFCVINPTNQEPIGIKPIDEIVEYENENNYNPAYEKDAEDILDSLIYDILNEFKPDIIIVENLEYTQETIDSYGDAVCDYDNWNTLLEKLKDECECRNIVFVLPEINSRA